MKTALTLVACFALFVPLVSSIGCASVEPAVVAACEAAENLLASADRLLLAARISHATLASAIAAAEDAGLLSGPAHERLVVALSKAAVNLATAELWHARAVSYVAMICDPVTAREARPVDASVEETEIRQALRSLEQSLGAP